MGTRVLTGADVQPEGPQLMWTRLKLDMGLGGLGTWEMDIVGPGDPSDREPRVLSEMGTLCHNCPALWGHSLCPRWRQSLVVSECGLGASGYPDPLGTKEGNGKCSLDMRGHPRARVF